MAASQRPSSWRFLLVCLFVGCVLLAGPALAGRPQTRGTFSGSLSVTSIRMLVRAVDAHGNPVSDLTPKDIRVLEDGKPVGRVTVVPFLTAHAAGRTRAPAVTLYFQNELLDRGRMRSAIKGLIKDAAQLTALGPVRIVVADPAPRVVADGVTAPGALMRILGVLPRKYPPHQKISRLRRQFNRDLNGSMGLTSRLAAMNYRQEEAVIRREIERMQIWAVSQPRLQDRILLVISGGFDLNPWEYYSTYVQWASGGALPGRKTLPEHDVVNETSVAALFEQVSQELAGMGWTVVSFTGGVAQTDTTSTADVSGNTRFETAESPYAVGMTPNQGTMLLHPNEPLRITAGVSGGSVAASPKALTKTLHTYVKAYELTYTVTRPPDGKLHHVEITPRRHGIVIYAPRLVRSVTKAGIDRNWALSLLDHRRVNGDLHVTAQLTGLSGSKRKGYRGRLVVRTNMSRFLELFHETGAPKIRLTIAADFGALTPFMTQWKPQPLRLVDSQGDWVGSCLLRWPVKAKNLAVVVSEAATDIWGGTVIPLPHPK